LTPPEEGKRSVSFNLSNSNSINSTLNIPKDLIEFAVSPAESIDIAIRDLSQDICVAMVDRDTEMKDLFIRNQEFFDTVKQSIFEDDESWEEFLKVLYSKREEKPDSEWMDSISEFLSANPPLLVNFKQIIGYYENDDDNDDHDHDDNIQEYEEEPYPDSCIIDQNTYVDITPIRDHPRILENLEKSYPQFFINAQHELGNERQRRGSASVLGGNHLCNDNPLLHPNVSSEEPSTTLYDEFKRILFTPRSEMSDVEWETAIYECLDPWPHLVAHLEEILVYEIEQYQ